jgi:hypothetical protein
MRRQAGRFLAAGVRTLALFGVRAHASVRMGPPLAEIVAEMAQPPHDLLILGAPLADRFGRVSLRASSARSWRRRRPGRSSSSALTRKRPATGARRRAPVVFR